MPTLIRHPCETLVDTVQGPDCEAIELVRLHHDPAVPEEPFDLLIARCLCCGDTWADRGEASLSPREWALMHECVRRWDDGLA